jgi:hypothetical protein
MHLPLEKWPVFWVFQRKTRKNRKNPVETDVLPLTIASESRKVNGGRFFRTRVNIGFSADWRKKEFGSSDAGAPSGDLKQATSRRNTRWQQQ